ncbi:cadherin-23-like [Gigantopelta aegis]|uniref:cadherin-23-like n=1 Tax=Gigantopelta aegis TaxID=1735272 RepID=UPI001B88D199|nr:cadherin-23-like [Gigantopelta aegis]
MRSVILLGAVLGFMVLQTEGAAPVISGTYTASMNEEEVVGTTVPFTFTATDADAGDILTYALSGVDSGKFAIDGSGVITISSVLNYESQTSFSITLEVTDTIATTTTVTQVLTLTLVDINDNSPVCTPSVIYSGAIAENNGANEIATTISCADADGSSPNNAVTISIQTPPAEFTMSGNDVVTTGTATNYEATPAYTLIIHAVDGGGTPNTGTVTVYIQIQPVNEFTPGWGTFTPVGSTHNINEDSPPGTSVVTVVATDSDTGSDGTVSYSLVSTVTDGGSSVAGIFSVDAISGQLTTITNIDRETPVAFYTVTARASDGGTPPKTIDTVLTININDINDNAPVFGSTSYSVSLLETATTAGASIITVAATDSDITAATLTYVIELGNTGNRFEFDGTTAGLLKLKAGVAIDLDTGTDPSFYTLRVIVKDGATPEKTGTSYVTITVNAVNEAPPVIGAVTPASPISVNEDIGIGTVIATVPATDTDSLSGDTITFTITAGNTNSDFVIDPNTGIVRNQNQLNYEVTPTTYTLTVTATDSGGLTDTVNIVVNVQDVNEASPTCPTYYVSATVVEPATVGDVVTTLACTDADTADTLTFTITTGDTSVFSMSSATKKLTLLTTLDYEGTKNYQLTIEVKDSTATIRTATVTVTVLVSPFNESPPTFTSAPYSVSVAENIAVGTSVQQITASDTDQGLLHGTLRYSITGGNGLGHFTIDSNGLVTTAQSLNRETTSTYTLDISVADDVTGAAEEHIVTTTVTVTVTDVNDNVPVFSPVFYTASHVETTPAATPLVTVTATDGDAGANAILVYSVSSGDIDNIFEMSGTNLQLQAGKSMNYLTRQIHDLVIEVTDQGATPLKAQARIVINVLSVNANPPVFAGGSVTLPAISETTAIGTTVYQAVATDSDGGANGAITYSIYSGNVPADSYAIESSTGKIIVWSLLDFDTPPVSYTLIIKAEDGGGKNDTMSVIIPLKDENDNVPNFGASIFNVNVDENVAVATNLAPAIAATDGDSGVNGQIAYSLVGGDGTSTFSIDATTGVIATTVAVDYESKKLYSLIVQAVDAGTPANSATCLVLITVNDLNDNAPVFTPVNVTISVTEAATVGTSIITVVANDVDSAGNQNNAITYALTDAFFQINPSTGEITTTAALNRESIPSHYLTVTAYDRTLGGAGSLTGTSVVTVDLSDVNDNAPVVSGTPYDLSISESLSPVSVVTTIAASDADAGDNARLNFTITNGNTNNDFTIEMNSGIIQVANALDRETTAGYLLEITVTDYGTPPKSVTVTCTVTILDANDNTPAFSQPSYNFSIAENVPLNSSAGFLAATDIDTGVNGALTFDFVTFWVGDSSHFLLNPASGEIISNSNLDRETFSVYEIWCRVSDGGTPKLSSEVNVTIHINDLNDNNPLFSANLYTGTVAENSAVGTTILTMTVIDLDVGVNAAITLSINTTGTSGTNADTFLAINSATGEITVKANIDREVYSSFVFEVIAVDAGTSPRSSSTSVSIDVTDVNDNTPVFSPVFYNTEIAYTGECDNSITTVTATDADSGSNGQVDYYLVQSTYQYLFSIDSAGVFSLRYTATANFKYTIEAGARDNGVAVSTATTSATVRIDTFDPNTVIVSFRLTISKTDFQSQQTTFLDQVQTLIRAKYPNAVVRLWCIEERSGTATTPSGRRRLLQTSAPVTVHVYTVADNTTDSAANINQGKTILTSGETLTFLTTDPNGSPSSAITGPAWDYFGIETVKQYYQTTTPWAQTTEGIAILAVVAIVVAFLIAVAIVIACWLYRKRKTRPQSATARALTKEKNSPPYFTTPKATIPDADKKHPLPAVVALPMPSGRKPKPVIPGKRDFLAGVTPPSDTRIPSPVETTGSSMAMNRHFNGTAVDPATGKVYEYNTETNERRWLETEAGKAVKVTHH